MPTAGPDSLPGIPRSAIALIRTRRAGNGRQKMPSKRAWRIIRLFTAQTARRHRKQVPSRRASKAVLSTELGKNHVRALADVPETTWGDFRSRLAGRCHGSVPLLLLSRCFSSKITPHTPLRSVTGCIRPRLGEGSSTHASRPDDGRTGFCLHPPLAIAASEAEACRNGRLIMGSAVIGSSFAARRAGR